LGGVPRGARALRPAARAARPAAGRVRRVVAAGAGGLPRDDDAALVVSAQLATRSDGDGAWGRGPRPVPRSPAIRVRGRTSRAQQATRLAGGRHSAAVGHRALALGRDPRAGGGASESSRVPPAAVEAPVAA